MEKIKNIIQTNKKNILIAIGFIVVIIICVIAFSKHKPRPVAPVAPVTTDETVLDGNTPETNVKPVKKATAGVSAVSISYEQALVTYKDSRIQLGSTDACAATPRTSTFKNGTTIMVDNRGPVVRTVKVGSTYTINAYDFKLITLSSTNLPETVYVDCNNQQNVATILIQK